MMRMMMSMSMSWKSVIIGAATAGLDNPSNQPSMHLPIYPLLATIGDINCFIFNLHSKCYMTNNNTTTRRAMAGCLARCSAMLQLAKRQI